MKLYKETPAFVKSALKKIVLVRAAVLAVTAYSLVLYLKQTLPELGETTFDDAYMYLRYAKHWLAGNGFSWNVSEGPAYGITSFLHLAAVTAVRGLTSLPDPMVLTTISFAAGLGAIAVLTVMGFLACKEIGRYWIPLLVVPCMALGDIYSYHSLSGMETTLSLLSNSVFACLVMLYVKRRGKVLFGLCLVSGYACFLARPDNGLYWLLLPPLFFMASDRQLWRPSLVYVAAAVLLLGADLVLKKAVLFGGFVPLSFFAKSAGFYRGYLGTDKWNAAWELYYFLNRSLPYLLALVCFISLRSLSKVAAILLPAAMTFGYYATVNQVMGMNARYYYPSVAFFVLAAFVVLSSHEEERSAPRDRGQGALPWRIAAAVILLTALTSPIILNGMTSEWQKLVIGRPTRFEPRRRYTTRAGKELPQFGERSWGKMTTMNALLDQMPAGIVLAASEYGYIGSQHPSMDIIDLVGLHDRPNTHYGFSAEYLFSRQPDIIWMPHPDYSYMLSEILDSGPFAEDYDFYPSAYDYGIAIRKHSRLSQGVHDALQRDFSRVYPGYEMQDYKAEPVEARYGQ